MSLKEKTLQIKTERGVTDVVIMAIHLCLTMVLVSKKNPCISLPARRWPSMFKHKLYLQSPLSTISVVQRQGLTVQVSPYKIFGIKDRRKIGIYIGKGRVKSTCILGRRGGPVAFCDRSDSAGGCARISCIPWSMGGPVYPPWMQ